MIGIILFVCIYLALGRGLLVLIKIVDKETTGPKFPLSPFWVVVAWPCVLAGLFVGYLLGDE